MAVRQRDSLMGPLDQLRFEPTAKRVRATLGHTTVVDSTRAVLLWEPRRVVPQYAVPASDILAPVVDAGDEAASEVDESVGVRLPEVSNRPIFDPSVPFAAHTSPGRVVEITNGATRVRAFRLDDPGPSLADYVVLDFDAFDSWRDEDEPLVGHPRDPFHRIDILPSSRAVRIEVAGTVVAESERAMFLFETLLPTRFYLPRDDVRVDLVESDTVTYCAYKGRATHLTPELAAPEATDLAWSYSDPLVDAERVRGLVAFYTERVDLILDGEPVERPLTPWSRR
jgi:uncharacterized protein (DUF427 family)